MVSRYSPRNPPALVPILEAYSFSEGDVLRGLSRDELFKLSFLESSPTAPTAASCGRNCGALWNRAARCVCNSRTSGLPPGTIRRLCSSGARSSGASSRRGTIRFRVGEVARRGRLRLREVRDPEITWLRPRVQAAVALAAGPLGIELQQQVIEIVALDSPRRAVEGLGDTMTGAQQQIAKLEALDMGTEAAVWRIAQPGIEHDPDALLPGRRGFLHREAGAIEHRMWQHEDTRPSISAWTCPTARLLCRNRVGPSRGMRRRRSGRSDALASATGRQSA